MFKCIKVLKFYFSLPRKYYDLKLKLEGSEREHEALVEAYKELENRVLNKTWRSVTKIDKNKVYYLVTQGGFYEIKGSNLLYRNCSEVSRRAYKNGFIVATRREALDLQSAMRSLVGKI